MSKIRRSRACAARLGDLPSPERSPGFAQAGAFGVARAGVLALMLALGPVPASAQAQTPEQNPSEMAREALEKLMRSLELLIGSIPQYEMPEVLPNGDIIIRRKPPTEPTPKPRPKQPDDEGAIEETRT